MPEGTSGTNPDKSATGGPQRGRKTPNPAISDEALAALERHYGSMNEEPARGDADSASATGFAAMLAQGSVAGGSSGGSSGAMSGMGGGQESNRRDSGEIPEAKIIAVRPDSASNDTQSSSSDSSTESAQSSADHAAAAPMVYATTPVEDVNDWPTRPQSVSPNRRPGEAQRRPGQSQGMPEHYKAFIPILIAMGLGALAVGIWAVTVLAGSSSSHGHHTAPSLFVEVSTLGIPLGLLMLGLSGFILKRYWKKR
ncbi:MAG: hypothetical protein ACP5O1_11375 [Phycisphaerae bacterium]